MKLIENNKEKWDKKRYAYVTTDHMDYNHTKPWWKRILKRIVCAWCVLVGHRIVMYTNTHDEYYRKNKVTKIELIMYYKKPGCRTIG